MISDKKFSTVHLEEHSKPSDYPDIEDYPGMLFYIQRNQNHNTVVYELNYTPNQMLNLCNPVLIHWLRYEDSRFVEKQQLNYLQKKLAYGYKFEVISGELIEFEFVSYDEIKFYIGKDNFGRYRVFFIDKGINIVLESVYIFAEDQGVFPQVKWAELYGKTSDSGQAFYKRIGLDGL